MQILKCPSCGATMNANDSVTVFYCNNCGTKIIESDEERALRLEREEKARQDQMELEKLRTAYDQQIKKGKFDLKDIVVRSLLLIAILIALRYWSHGF